MVDWAFSGSCQKSGALIFRSSAANCGSIAEASKITPHEFDALLEFGVALLQIFDMRGHI
jgi:molybdenum cofactor biosynthesis enzyme